MGQQTLQSKQWWRRLLILGCIACLFLFVNTLLFGNTPLQLLMSESAAVGQQRKLVMKVLHKSIGELESEVQILQHEAAVFRERLQEHDRITATNFLSWRDRAKYVPMRENKAGSAPPLSVLVSGHEQGSTWFVEITKQLVDLTSKLEICSPPQENGYREQVNGMWRWAAEGSAFGKSVGACGLLETQTGLHRTDRAREKPAAPQLIVAFDLGGKDLDLLAQDCVPGYVPAFPRRTTETKPCAMSTAPFAMVRLVRDPRDVIVSGYHHHKSCHRAGYTVEEWTTVKKAEYGGMSYCDKLNSVGLSQGLLLEMQLAGRTGWLNNMLSSIRLIKRRPVLANFIHFITYEHLYTNLNATMQDLAIHLFPSHAEMAQSFSQIGTDHTLAAHLKNSDRSADTAGWYMRNDMPSQWQKFFNRQLVAYFVEYGLEEVVEFFNLEPSMLGLKLEERRRK